MHRPDSARCNRAQNVLNLADREKKKGKKKRERKRKLATDGKVLDFEGGELEKNRE